MKRLGFFVWLLSILVLTAAGCGLVTTGESAAEKAGEIATFEIPAGYTPEVGMDLAGTVMVGYTGPDANSHIYLIQAPAASNLSQAQLEQSLRDALASADGTEAAATTDLQEVPMTIRGEEVTATLGTTTGSGGTMRVLTVPFTGNGGPALLLIQAPEAAWDQAVVDDFIASFE